MKKLIFMLSLLLLSLSASAQQIVAVEDVQNFTLPSVNSSAYFKDVNNILDKYIGVWESEDNEKQYKLDIVKLENISIDKPSISYDGLGIRYKITDKATGNELYNTLNFDSQDKIIKKPHFVKIRTNKYVVLYLGDDEDDIECGDLGPMYIDFINPLTLEVYVEPTFFVNYIRDGVNKCPNGSVPPPFPKKKADALTFTKVTSQPGLGN